MHKENPTETDDNIGFDNDESGDNNDTDISDKDTADCHKHGDACDKCSSKNDTKRGGKMSKLKIFETALSAALALITAAMHIIKFIKYLYKFKPA